MSAAFRFFSILSLTDRWLTEYQRQARGTWLCGPDAGVAPHFTCAKSLNEPLKLFISPQLLRATPKAAIIVLPALKATKDRQAPRPMRIGGRVSVANQNEGISLNAHGRDFDFLQANFLIYPEHCLSGMPFYLYRSILHYYFVVELMDNSHSCNILLYKIIFNDSSSNSSNLLLKLNTN